VNVRLEALDPEGEATEGVFFQRAKDGLRVGGGGQVAQWAEVSLPRVLGHQSGKEQISTDEQLEMALWSLRESVRQVAPEASISGFQRADIAWQWKETDTRSTIGTLAYLRHPNVRKATTLYAGESVHWPGVDLHLRVYDARREMEKRSGDVLRVEAQLRGPHATSMPLQPTIAQLYQTLRGVVAPLKGALPARVSSVPRVQDLLSACAQIGVKFPGTGVDLAQWYLNAQTRATRYRLIRAMRDSRLRALFWSWDDVLPPAVPPAGEWVHLRAA
jgi:hypothetical protein